MQNINKDYRVSQYHSFCPICHNDVLYYKFTINSFTIVQCPSCDVLLVKEKLTQQELDAYYAKNDDEVYLDNKAVMNLNYYYFKLRSFILGKIQTGSILDIGCSAGYFLDVMKGFECYGIDRFLTYGKIAKEKHGENIFIGTFEDYKPPSPGFLFDCITLQDVLDHMINPIEVLRKCNELLKTNGILIVKVHDMSCLYAKITGKNFYAFIPPEHLFYFNKTSIMTALKKASFNVIFSKHIGHMMFLSTVFYRLSKKNQNSIFFHLYKLIKGTWLGHKRIYRNLHDIITVFAVKK